jgi:hypothetical protein
LTRDYLYGIKDETLRKAKLIPFTGLYKVDEDQEEDEEQRFVFDQEPTKQNEPDLEYFRVKFV